MEQVRIANDTVEVMILPDVGARLHRLRVDGHDLLRTPADPSAHLREPFFWGAYVMAPWCNRIEAGRLPGGSRQVALDANFPDGSAIHGQVYARPWQRLADGEFRVFGGNDGWPWPYEVRLRIELLARLLRVEGRLTNRADDPMPAGIGLHPWFRRPLLLAIRGDAVHPTNADTLPEAERVSGSFDRRTVGEMAADLDATWTQLREPAVELRWPSFGVDATMRITTPTPYVVAASPSHLDAIAIEPQTHAPQGMRRILNREPGALALLEPGATLGLTVEIAFA